MWTKQKKQWKPWYSYKQGIKKSLIARKGWVPENRLSIIQCPLQIHHTSAQTKQRTETWGMRADWWTRWWPRRQRSQMWTQWTKLAVPADKRRATLRSFGEILFVVRCANGLQAVKASEQLWRTAKNRRSTAPPYRLLQMRYKFETRSIA